MTTPPRTTDKVYFCPQCIKPTVDASSLAGSTCSCRGCGWSGPQEELLVHEVTHEFANQGEMLTLFAKDIRLFLAHNALEFGKILIKWGLLPNTPSRQLIVRYVLAAAKGIATSVMEEREKIEIEATMLEKARSKKGSKDVS